MCKVCYINNRASEKFGVVLNQISGIFIKVNCWSKHLLLGLVYKVRSPQSASTVCFNDLFSEHIRNALFFDSFAFVGGVEEGVGVEVWGWLGRL